MAEFVIEHAGRPYRIKNVVNEQQARIKLENYLAKQKVESGDMTPLAFDSGRANPVYEERFGDTIEYATRNPREAFFGYGGRMVAPDRSLLQRGGDAAMAGLSGLATGVNALAGLIGELGGNKTQERKLARDMGIMLEMPVLPTGVSSGVASLGRQTAYAPTVKTLTAGRVNPRQVGEVTKRMEAAEAAENLGIEPNLGMMGRPQALLEAGLEANPLSGGIITKSKEKIIDRAQEVATDVANRTGTIKTMEEAGGDIRAGADLFKSKFRNVQEALYKKVDNLIPPETPVVTTKTNELFAELSAAGSGSKAIQNFMGYSDFNSILKDLQKGVDYRTLKELRTRFGESLKNPAGEISRTIGQQNVNKIYKALTQDMKAAAASKGEGALKAWKLANDYTSKKMDIMDDILKDIFKADTNQAAYNAVTRTLIEGGAKQSTSKLAQIKKALPKDEFNNFTATMINELGSTTSAVKGTGTNFSIKTFSTNLEKMQPAAKKVLFGDKAADLEELNNILKRANLAGLEKNFSGTGNVVSTIGIGALAVQDLALAGGLATVLAGSSYLLTSKPFLRAVNRAAKKDLGPLQKIAAGEGKLGSAEAKEILRVLGASTGNQEITVE
jgi:hypothetical protein